MTNHPVSTAPQPCMTQNGHAQLRILCLYQQASRLDDCLIKSGADLLLSTVAEGAAEPELGKSVVHLRILSKVPNLKTRFEILQTPYVTLGDLRILCKFDFEWANTHLRTLRTPWDRECSNVCTHLHRYEHIHKSATSMPRSFSTSMSTSMSTSRSTSKSA